MKKIYSLLLFVCGLMMTACTDTWDDYYDSSSISKNKIEEIEDCSVMEFFDRHSDYGQFFDLLKDAGIADELSTSGQEFTLWVVNDSNFVEGSGTKSDEALVELDTARLRYHVNYLSITRDQLSDGKRLKTLNGTYLQITDDNQNGLCVDDIKVLRSYRLNNGVVYEIESMMVPRVNLYDYIISLPDDYSIFRDSLRNRSSMIFDTARSTPIGIDPTGNILYDSAKMVYNPLFDTARINSEYYLFTCFLPDNEVMEGCFDKLNETFQSIGRPENTSSPGDSLYTGYRYLFPKDLTMAINWIQRAVIFKDILDESATQPGTGKDDISSIFDKQWRKSVQTVDISRPYEEGSSFHYKKLSNGRVYKVTDLKIPNNVIISRLKQFAYHLTWIDRENAEQQKYLCVKNLDRVVRRTDDAFPDNVLAAGYPSAAFSEYTNTRFENTSKGQMGYTYADVTGGTDPTEFSVSFTPLQPTAELTTGEVAEYRIPVGEYQLCMGFRSKDCCIGDVYFATAELSDDKLQYDPADRDKVGDAGSYGSKDVKLKDGGYSLVGSAIDFSLSTPWNYDRSGSGGDDKFAFKRLWNSNGGPVGNVTVKGDPGTMQSVRIKVQYRSGAKKRIELYHWCLIPTENNY